VAIETTQYQETYQHALTSAMAVRHHHPGVIRLTGNDRRAFLHRMTTNAVEDLSSWTLRSTVLTTPLARIIDRLWVIDRDNDLLVLTSPNRGQIVQSWLSQHIFFNDAVQAQIATENWSLWGVYGPESIPQVQSHFGFQFPSQTDAGVPIQEGLALRWSAPAGVRLLLKPSGNAKATEAWPDANTEAAAVVFEALRVEAGYPLYGQEFTDDNLPLEAGLRSAIDFHKGCYTGQEIIARMDSRGQLARQLVGLYLSHPGAPGKIVTKKGQQAGELTSCANSPRLGWIGLGVIRTQYLESDASLILAESGQPIQSVTLPFSNPD
jgi:aminomethyltransferase